MSDLILDESGTSPPHYSWKKHNCISMLLCEGLVYTFTEMPEYASKIAVCCAFIEIQLQRRELQQWVLKDCAFRLNSRPRLKTQTSALALTAQRNQFVTRCLVAVTEKSTKYSDAVLTVIFHCLFYFSLIF